MGVDSTGTHELVIWLSTAWVEALEIMSFGFRISRLRLIQMEKPHVKDCPQSEALHRRVASRGL